MGLLEKRDGEAAAEPPVCPEEAVRAERLVLVLLEFVVLLFFTREIFRNSRVISFGFNGIGKGAVPLPP